MQALVEAGLTAEVPIPLAVGSGCQHYKIGNQVTVTSTQEIQQKITDSITLRPARDVMWEPMRVFPYQQHS